MDKGLSYELEIRPVINSFDDLWQATASTLPSTLEIIIPSLSYRAIDHINVWEEQ